MRSFARRLTFFCAIFAVSALGSTAYAADAATPSPSPSPSAPSANAWQPLWDQYVGGKPMLPETVTQLDQWLIPDGNKNACSKQVEWVLSTLSKYGTKVFDDNGKNAQKISQSIYQYLVGLHNSNNACYEMASEAYLMGSVFEFDKYDASKVSARVTTGCKNDCEGPPQSLYLLLLTKALLKAGAIHFVTPSSCSIEFAYLCDPGSIQLNPISKPIDQGGIYGSSPEDFAGHYVHELSHLFRDKFVSEAYVKSHFADPNDPSGIDWKSYLLLDETLAKVIAGSIQISNQQEVWDDGNNASVVGDDLTLFQKNGPLEHLYDGSSYGGNLNPFATYSEFIGITFLKQSRTDGTYSYYAEAPAPDYLTSVREIYTTLQSSYFPGIDPSESTIDVTSPSSALNPMNQSLDFDPLNVLLSEDRWGVDPYVNQKTAGLPDSDVWQIKDQFGMQIGPFKIMTPINFKSDTVVPIKMLLQEVVQVVDSLKSATPVCQDFNHALTNAVEGDKTDNPMSDYLGGSCIKSGGPNGPVQPENGGRTDSPGRPDSPTRP